ncbi:MAG TPA: hypothetical protein VG602_03470 [Actinomycetota bacterium]|nr:hypothetical protein [Actinomycetota bacterium]
MKKGFFALLVMLPLSLPVPAGADFAKFRDRNDTPSPLDIRWVSHGHRGKDVEHQIVTYKPWDVGDLRRNWFAMHVNLVSDDPDATEQDFGTSWDYAVSVSARGKGLTAEIWREDVEPSQLLGEVPALHPTPKKLVIRIPRQFLDAAPGPYEWNAGSVFAGHGKGACAKKSCDDWTGKRWWNLEATHKG